ncbi:hypothetical protein FKR81_13670 [Lentzea tibetensis]|uniref:Secreted protein n=1 Tax=Lentzea tibetensis TaxID=2591470 RepID=A0A563EWN7_9PSEU|nr:hypothetical protein [Lentzea tibetensis]TWP51891.1 hypothetical protein FKR81_13670 [Lentzea tibetensis]
MRFAALAVALLFLGAGTADAAAIRGWRQVDRTTVSRTLADEGLGTNKSVVYYRGNAGIPQPIKDEGWGHIGDTDAIRGHVFDAYQWTKDTSRTTKMFLVTLPDGRSFKYEHELEPGEPSLNANSFVTVSPDGQWLVAGTLEKVQELFVFPAPVLNPRVPAGGGKLPLVGRIKLDRPVRSVQGCDFINAVRILCGTSDNFNDLFPTSMSFLQLDLAGPVRGGDNRARIQRLGQVPMDGTCTGSFVTEGVDYDVATGLLRMSVNLPTPCSAETAVYTFRRR